MQNKPPSTRLNPPSLPEGAVALFFDLDGTLAPIAPRPQDAEISPEMRRLLMRLYESNDGALAVISGRSLQDIDLLVGRAIPASGQHGLEMRYADGTIARQDEGRVLIAQLAEEVRLFHQRHPALVIEEKGLSIAVHFRQATEFGGVVEDLLATLARRHPDQLTLQHGKMVVELRLKGGSKGEAIRQLMTTAPFAGKLPVFVGDDLTDETGFAVVNTLHGISIKIGEGETDARYRLADVADLQGWLETLDAHQSTTGLRQAV